MSILAKIPDWVIPIVAYGLGILCPAVPAFVWTPLLRALKNGDVTAQHIHDFMVVHDIHTYYSDEDFPSPPPPPNLNRNFNKAEG